MHAPEPLSITLQGRTVQLDEVLAWRCTSWPRPTMQLHLTDGTKATFWDGDADQVETWLARVLASRRG